MLTTNENGEREVTFLGLFVLALFLSLILVFMQWLLQMKPGTYVGAYLAILLPYGRTDSWSDRIKAMGLMTIAYYWCVSLGRVVGGGDLAPHAWATLGLLVAVPFWWWSDRREAAKKASQERQS